MLNTFDLQNRLVYALGVKLIVAKKKQTARRTGGAPGGPSRTQYMSSPESRSHLYPIS